MKNLFLLIILALCSFSLLQCSAFYSVVEKAKEVSKNSNEDENNNEGTSSDSETTTAERQRKSAN